MNDKQGKIYRLLRWLNEGSRQTERRYILWRLRACHEDRIILKQKVRQLESELNKKRSETRQGYMVIICVDKLDAHGGRVHGKAVFVTDNATVVNISQQDTASYELEFYNGEEMVASLALDAPFRIDFK